MLALVIVFIVGVNALAFGGLAAVVNVIERRAADHGRAASMPRRVEFARPVPALPGR